MLEALAAEEAGFGGWAALRPPLHKLLSDVLQVLAARAPSAEYATGQCRALYGLDVLLARPNWRERAAADDGGGKGGVQPVLVEVNYSPDLSTLLAFYPSFVDDVFRRLFLAEEEQEVGRWDVLTSAAV